MAEKRDWPTGRSMSCTLPRSANAERILRTYVSEFFLHIDGQSVSDLIEPRPIDPRPGVGEERRVAETLEVLDEGLQDAPGGLRRSGRQESGGFEVERTAEAAIRPEVETSLQRGDRGRRPSRESRGGRLGLGEEPLLGHDPMHQAVLERLLRRQRNAFENVLERAR